MIKVTDASSGLSPVEVSTPSGFMRTKGRHLIYLKIKNGFCNRNICSHRKYVHIYLDSGVERPANFSVKIYFRSIIFISLIRSSSCDLNKWAIRFINHYHPL